MNRLGHQELLAVPFIPVTVHPTILNTVGSRFLFSEINPYSCRTRLLEILSPPSIVIPSTYVLHHQSFSI